MTALSVEPEQAARPSVVAPPLPGLGFAALGLAGRVGVVLERLFTLLVLGLMAAAGVVIVVVTFGVMAGFID